MSENTVTNYQLIPALIDSLGYMSGNYALHSLSKEMPKANLKHTLVFGITDLAIRNQYFTYMSSNSYFTGDLGKNAYIGLVSFAANSVLDMLSSKDFAEILKKNALRSAVGVGTNTLLDKFIVPSNYA